MAIFQRVIPAALLLAASVPSPRATAQDTVIIEIGNPNPTASVSPGGISEALEAFGTSNGMPFLFRGGQTLAITLPGEILSSNGIDLSANGIAVGTFTKPDDNNVQRGYRLDTADLSFNELSPPATGNPFSVRALAISRDGNTILGEATNYDDGTITHVRRPVLWTDGLTTATDAGSNDLVFTYIGDVNNNGWITGTARYAALPGVEWRGFVRKDGVWTDVGDFGGSRTDARAVNNLGVAVGNSRNTQNNNVAFKWDPDTESLTQLLPSFDLCRSIAYDINDAGIVVGFGSCSSTSRALYWLPGDSRGRKLNDLLPPNSGWSNLTYAQAVDNCGVVIGQGIRQDRPGYFSAFMLVLPDYDQDKDGLADCWERDGLDINGDGTVDLDLPAMGADPMRKDVFVEIDAMTGRAPAANVLSRVTTAFANAPVPNPDGSTGITLHPILDETNLTRRAYPNNFTEFNQDKDDHFGTVIDRISGNAEHILAAKRLAFRYCIFADTYNSSTSSGFAETPGNDFMVTLGGWSPAGGTPDQQAGTFMHELGHTLGLRHGGGDNTNYKPNYYSVMNYTWQSPNPAFAPSWRLDYSRVQLPTLNESALTETDGLGGAPGSLPSTHVLFRASNGRLLFALTSGPESIDWSGDGMFSNMPDVAADLNRILLSKPPSPGESLTGFNDWPSLVYNFKLSPSFSDGVHETTEELTYEAFLETNDELGNCPADLAEPFGLLDLADAVAFVTAFSNGDPAADFAEPVGLLDLADIIAFVTAFNAGCP